VGSRSSRGQAIRKKSGGQTMGGGRGSTSEKGGQNVPKILAPRASKENRRRAKRGGGGKLSQRKKRGSPRGGFERGPMRLHASGHLHGGRRERGGEKKSQRGKTRLIFLCKYSQ